MPRTRSQPQDRAETRGEGTGRGPRSLTLLRSCADQSTARRAPVRRGGHLQRKRRVLSGRAPRHFHRVQFPRWSASVSIEVSSRSPFPLSAFRLETATSPVCAGRFPAEVTQVAWLDYRESESGSDAIPNTGWLKW